MHEGSSSLIRGVNVGLRQQTKKRETASVALTKRSEMSLINAVCLIHIVK